MSVKIDCNLFIKIGYPIGYPIYRVNYASSSEQREGNF